MVAAHGDHAAVQVEGRDAAAAAVDQPKVTDGRWVRAGGVVVERSFADAFDAERRGADHAERPPLPGRRHRGDRRDGAVPRAVTRSARTGNGGSSRASRPRLGHADRRSRLAAPTQKPSYVINLRLAEPRVSPGLHRRSTSRTSRSVRAQSTTCPSFWSHGSSCATRTRSSCETSSAYSSRAAGCSACSRWPASPSSSEAAWRTRSPRRAAQGRRRNPRPDRGRAARRVPRASVARGGGGSGIWTLPRRS